MNKSSASCNIWKFWSFCMNNLWWCAKKMSMKTLTETSVLTRVIQSISCWSFEDQTCVCSRNDLFDSTVSIIDVVLMYRSWLFLICLWLWLRLRTDLLNFWLSISRVLIWKWLIITLKILMWLKLVFSWLHDCIVIFHKMFLNMSFYNSVFFNMLMIHSFFFWRQ